MFVMLLEESKCVAPMTFLFEFWLKKKASASFLRLHFKLPMAAPKTSTPYFSASEQKSEVRERSPRRVAQRKSMSSGHVVEEQSKFCEHHGQMVGYIRGRFGESSIAMDFSCSYKGADLEKWTKATKFKIWEAARSEWTEEEPQQIGTDGLVLNATTLFEETT